MAQSSPFRAVFVVESRDDPAFDVLEDQAMLHAGRIEIVVSGIATDQGQKIHNLLAGVATLRADDRYLVFLDADIDLTPHVVGRLLHPLVRQQEKLTTGYRWLYPDPASPASWLAASINLQVATLPRRNDWNLPWGGATAMLRETFEELDLVNAWKGCLSDDLQLRQAARRHAVPVRAVYDVLVATPAPTRFADLWRFGVRQYRHVVWNVWRYAFVARAQLNWQSIGWAVALYNATWWAIVIGYVAAAARALLRVAIARKMPNTDRLRPYLSVAADLAVPFVVYWLHLAMVLTAMTSSKISWAGTDYWMKSGKVRKLRRG